MQNLTTSELNDLQGGDFWGGVKCGLAAAGLLATVATGQLEFIGLTGTLVAVECLSA